MVPINIEENKFNEIKKEYKERIINSFRTSTWDAVSKKINNELSNLGITESIDEILVADYRILEKIKEKFDSSGKQFLKYKCDGKIDENKYIKDSIYKQLYNKYDSLDKMWIIEKLGITVCPYCNRSFINGRDKRTTAQLDHFYPRSKYPIFSLSLCNLIPSCYGCNQIKSANEIGASPYDKSINFTKEIRFSYMPTNEEFLCNSNNLEVIIKSSNNSIKKNIDTMKIKYAYEQDNDYVFELILKSRIYNENFKMELLNNYSDLISSEDELNRLLYGNYLNDKDYNKRPLSKLTHDILLELGVID